MRYANRRPQLPVTPPQDRAYERAASAQNGLGYEPDAPSTDARPLELPDKWKNWTQIPAWYVVTLTLGGAAGNTAENSEPLRPEPFVLTRISFATTGDALAQAAGFPFNSGASVQGRSVRVGWSDEFTKFMGKNPMLVSAIFGDSNGFLDIPAPVLLQGKQSLYITLSRLLWPFDTELVPAQNTVWDFVFTGVALLPPGVQSSGSVG